MRLSFFVFQVAVTITSEKSVRNVLSSIARELFKADISWGKIVSLYCTAGGLGRTTTITKKKEEKNLKMALIVCT